MKVGWCGGGMVWRWDMWRCDSVKVGCVEV